MTATGAGPRDPVAVARQAILALVERECAVVQPEIEARLCEQPQPGLLARLDPMDVRIALDDLEAAGQLRRLRSRSPYSHREIPVFTSAGHDESPEQRAAAEHKRDLLARYLSWGDGPDSPLRAGAEQVVHASFQVAARSGFQIGQAPPSDVAIFVPHDRAGTPEQPILMPIAVHNTREWLMPHSRGLYRLLITATRIQVAERDVPLVPVFVSRRADPRLVAMGRDLGFIVIESRREFILPSVAETAVAEVRATLGLTDLTRADGADRLMVSRLEQIVPSLAVPLVARWRRTAMTTIPLRFATLVDEATLAGRRRVVREIRDLAAGAGLAARHSSW